MKKQVLKISVMGLFLAGTLTFAGCGSNSSSDNAGQQEEKHQHEGDDHEDGDQQSAYICPMECEGSASEEAGKCPECGMDLVKRSELDEEGQ